GANIHSAPILQRRASRRFSVRSRSLVRLMCAALLAPIAALASGSDVVVVRVGAAGDMTTLSGTSASVFLERRMSDGSLGAGGTNPIALPTAASAANQPFTLSGSATSEGAIAVSADGLYVTLAGYGTGTGTATVSTTSSSTVNRVVARVDGAGDIDTSTYMNT